MALLLVDAVVLEPDALADRLGRAAAPPVAVGTACVPPDDPDELLDVAEDRLQRSLQCSPLPVARTGRVPREPPVPYPGH